MADAEEKEAQELMAKLGVDGDVPSDDESVEALDPEEVLEQYRREITISPDNCVDQVILGTSDLDKAVDDFEKMTGVRPVWVTSMNGAGTKSARIAFEECAYLEIIGPDAKQPDTAFSMALAALPAGELVPCHYAIRLEKSKELDVRMEWKKIGLQYDQITMVAKDKGMPWLWDMYFMKGDGKIEMLGVFHFVIHTLKPFFFEIQQASHRLSQTGRLMIRFTRVRSCPSWELSPMSLYLLLAITLYTNSLRARQASTLARAARSWNSLYLPKMAATHSQLPALLEFLSPTKAVLK